VAIVGYRSIQLKNGYSEEMEITSLLVHIDVRNPKVWFIVVARESVSNLITSAKEVVFSSALVFLFVSKNMQKLIGKFPQNLLESWHMNHGRNH